MKVTVCYSGQLKAAAGAAREEHDVVDGCSVRELVLGVAERKGDPLRSLMLDSARGLRPHILVCIDDEQVDWATQKLKAGDEVLLMSPISGG
jgi:molybdopterin converting factor small subunit